jgi:hypothetical protein
MRKESQGKTRKEGQKGLDSYPSTESVTSSMPQKKKDKRLTKVKIQDKAKQETTM